MHRNCSLSVWIATLCSGVCPLLAQNADVTYQGFLKDAGAAVDSSADLVFRLYDAASGGSSIGSAVTASDVVVVDGLFTVDLDFNPGVFDGSPLWLEVDVRSPHDPSDTQPYETLSPRQPLTAAPFAMHALNGSIWSLSGADAYYELGNVGIGTVNPSGPLQLNDPGDASAIRFGATPHHLISNRDFVFNAYDQDGSADGDSLFLFRRNTNKFDESTFGELVAIDDSGKVGIGTRTPGSVIGNSKLDVIDGHVAVSNNYGFFSFNGAGTGLGAGMDTTTTDDLEFYAGGVAQMSVGSDGRVGIGASSPSARLTVEENTSNAVAISGLYTGASGNAGHFACANAGNSETALTGIHAGSGKALLAYNYGTGMAAEITIANPAGTEPALLVTNAGSGPAIEALGDVHVAGAAIFDGAVTIPTSTRYAMISAPAFHPQSGSTTIVELGGTPVVTQSGIDITASTMADVALPDGARITELRAFLTDSSNLEDMTVELSRYGLTGSSASLASTTSSGSSSTPRAFAKTLSHIVDNQSYAYFVKVSWTDNPTGTFSLRSVRIKYTVDEPLP